MQRQRLASQRKQQRNRKMKYNIIYDKPGRLRLRCGAYAFDKRHEAYLLDLIGKCSYVVSAEVHSENGGILVCYRAGFRQAVLDLVAGIGKGSLKTISTPEGDIRKIDDTYKGQLRGMVLRRCLKRLLLPAPIRHIMTFVRGLSYVAKGISTLLGGELTVDVLDGASVGASDAVCSQAHAKKNAKKRKQRQQYI